jgi:hypothetical protein
MDLKIKEDIQFEALSVYSETHVKARENIVDLRNKIADSNTNINDIGILQQSLDNAMKLYNHVRMQQALKKQEVLNKLNEKYPQVDSTEIRHTLEAAINDYENEFKNRPILSPKPAP